MRITRSDGPVGIITALYGDEYGVGTFCTVGPWVFICEDTREDADHHFWPEMRATVKAMVWHKHWRRAYFCGERFYRRMEWVSIQLTELLTVLRSVWRTVTLR